MKLAVYLFLLLPNLVFAAPSFYKCSCTGSKGHVVCGSADFGNDPDGYNVQSEDPEAEAAKLCLAMNPYEERVSCSCTAD